ncbi:hypothetical protein GGS21DRAFT_329696 [Xylaria nigripes]|nr:hypothetical protein GGS21DRAFT_329696 [Xylaria nigripes]
MLTSSHILMVRDWFIFACLAFALWAIQTLNLPRSPLHIRSANGNITAIPVFNLGATAFRELATWQLCNMDRDSRGRWELYRDSKCAHVYALTWDTTRLEILAHAPRIKVVFDIEDRGSPIQIRINRHLQLAVSAVAEVQSRFPIGTDFLRRINDICVDLPWFNATMAEVLPWYDLFREWHRLLSVKLISENPSLEDPVLLDHQPQFKAIEAHLLRGMDIISEILEIRVDPLFKDLVRKYEGTWCDWDC